MPAEPDTDPTRQRGIIVFRICPLVTFWVGICFVALILLAGCGGERACCQSRDA